MSTVLLIIHLIIAIALVSLVLLQRSEGGALGIGGGGGAGGLMTSRGAANVLTRATAFLALGFFATSIALTMLARQQVAPKSILDSVPAESEMSRPAPEAPPVPEEPAIPVPE